MSYWWTRYTLHGSSLPGKILSMCVCVCVYVFVCVCVRVFHFLVLFNVCYALVMSVTYVNLFDHTPCSYENPEVALNCGMMLRECIRHESLCKVILFSQQFYNFFGFVEVSTFDVASDAFSTFKVTGVRLGGTTGSR